MTADWKDWCAGWLKEGNFISYRYEGIRYYERVLARDLGHYEWAWGDTATPTSIPAGEQSGGFVPDLLEITVGYNEETKLNRIWQMIFGIKGQAYIYVQLPTDIKRHGIPKRPFPSTGLRQVAHFEEYMSPYHEPTFLTEHFMRRRETLQIDFTAYNPNAIPLTDVWLNIFLNKMVTERIGSESYDEAGLHLTPAKPHLEEVLGKLYRRLIPCRPISIQPVRAPAEASRGE